MINVNTKQMDKINISVDRFKKVKPEKNMHGDLQLITKEIWEYCGKDKPFAFYLGIIKRIGTDRARYILGNLKDRATPAHTPGKLFVWMAKNNK